ncbi:hypothetical protein BDR07DRAFT_420032 [Suillus spraguei]|nr:hypothetical protein BDR07DRAFT_420032 [Suillus spraguei]
MVPASTRPRRPLHTCIFRPTAPHAQSSPMMGRTPSPDMRMPSPMIGEYMTVEGPGDEEEELPEDDGEIDFDFSNAPQQRGSKGARRWIGGFVKGLRNFPGLRKSPQRPSPSGDFVSSIDAHHENDVQFPTISSLRLRPLTPTGIAQTAELMEMPQPLVYPQPSPQHTYQQPHVHRPPPPAPSSPVYAPGADVVPQVLSTVDERSSEQTGTHEIHPHPHSSVDHTHSHHTHSPRTHTHAHSHSQHSHSHSQPHLHSHLHSQSHSSTVQPAHPNTTFTVTDYVTVPPPQWPSPPPSTRIKRFLRNLDQLPWVENEQIVDAYFPGRSSRHRRHPDSPVDDGKPAASWYNKRHNSLPREMGAGPSASLMYGWPPQMQKAYSHQGIVYSQFPYGYTPVQPAFVYPTTFPPPGTH